MPPLEPANRVILRKKRRRITVAVVIGFLLFLLCIPFIGIYIFDVADTFLANRALGEGSTLTLIIFLIIIFSILLWYIIYQRAVMKLRVELSISEKMEEFMFSVEKFQKLFENAPIPYVILEGKGRIKDLNKAALRFFHGTNEELIMTDLFSYLSPENAVDASQLAKYYELRTSIDKRQVRMVNRKNETRWVELSIFTLHDSDVGYSGFVSILDITDQKNLDQTKTEFISLASHQMRTPLATTKWYTEMLLSPNFGELNPKQKEYVQTMNEVTTDMIELVNTLLNISRLEIGKITVDMEATNVQEISDSILKELTSQISKKSMNISKEYNSLFANVRTDPKLLRIIIHNLLTNAIKYTPDGGTITIAFAEKDGKHFVTVTDTGYGIPENQQGKIFSKLFRADNVKDKSSSQSTGLGLYLIKSLVEAIGGSIGFKSAENKGSSFTIQF